jgi:hypothetical protein
VGLEDLPQVRVRTDRFQVVPLDWISRLHTAPRGGARPSTFCRAAGRRSSSERSRPRKRRRGERP